jgi:hypothetical protein
VLLVGILLVNQKRNESQMRIVVCLKRRRNRRRDFGALTVLHETHYFDTIY